MTREFFERHQQVKVLLTLTIKLFVFLIVWAGTKQSRSPGAEQPTQVRVYQLPVAS